MGRREKQQSMDSGQTSVRRHIIQHHHLRSTTSNSGSASNTTPVHNPQNVVPTINVHKPEMGLIDDAASLRLKLSKARKKAKRRVKKKTLTAYLNDKHKRYVTRKVADKELDEVDDDLYDSFEDLPDELVIAIFRFLPVVDLARAARTSRRWAVLWVQGVHTVEVKGRLRKMKEDDFVHVVRKFVRLESLDLCNTGSSEDFQMTDKGLLQLAHKYIYSNADYLAVPREDPLSGNYDFNFDYESHLDSLDLDDSLFDDTVGSFTGDFTAGETTELTSDLDTADVADDDELSSDTSSLSQCSSNPSLSSIDICTPLSNGRRIRMNQLHPSALAKNYNLNHIYYVYPPPRYEQRQQVDKQEPHYGLHTLRSLSFLGSHNITENGIKYLTFFCQNLRDLNLKGCTKVNDNALSYLAQFEHIVNLDLTGCVHISDLGLRHLSNSKAKKNIKYLDLTFCHKITDEGLEHLSQLTSIEQLNLQCCRHITSRGLSKIINSCSYMRSLNLTGCDKAMLSGIDAPHGLPQLERLNMMGCKLTSDACMANLASWTQNLKELVLAFSDHTTDKGIKCIVEGSSHLKSLNLKRCENITDLSLEYISMNLCDTLQYLNLTGCRKFSNRGLGCLTTLRHLEELLLRKCYQINEEGMDYVSMCISLSKLDISECNKVTDESLKRLCRILCDPMRIQQHLDKQADTTISRSGLTELKVEKCPLVSKDTLDILQISYSHVVFSV